MYSAVDKTAQRHPLESGHLVTLTPDPTCDL